MYLVVVCAEHGKHAEKVESDINFFKQGYSGNYHRKEKHLVLPITYRCNLQCRFCYTLSNSNLSLPKDRSLNELAKIMEDFKGNITLIGGEPTTRSDLFDIIRIAKNQNSDRKISLATNGLKLKERSYLEGLREAGLDFVFFSLNDREYETSHINYLEKLVALQNCSDLSIPVWLQRTIDDVNQLDSIIPLLEKYKRNIFNVTIRSVSSFGIQHPENPVFLSEMLEHLGMKEKVRPGVSPFNRRIRLKTKKVKLCFWVNDMKVLDPLDSFYYITENRLTTYHRGMRLDDLFLKQSLITS